MKPPLHWRQIKMRSLPIIRARMVEGGEWAEAMADIQSILGPQFDELPSETLLRAWWDESNVNRGPRRLRPNSQIAGSSQASQDSEITAKRVSHQESQSERHTGIAPTAFVSYSWDDEAHKTWVKELAARLRGDGIDVTLDQWSIVYGDNLPQFMERGISESDYVLVICSPRYKTKSDGKLGGTGYEESIMSGELLLRGNPRKYIPILRRGEWIESAPTRLAGSRYVDMRETSNFDPEYRELLRTLHGAAPSPPPLGPRPSDV